MGDFVCTYIYTYNLHKKHYLVADERTKLGVILFYSGV